MSVKVLSTSTETVVTTTYNIEYKGVKYTLADYTDENNKIIESTLRDENGDLIEDSDLFNEICEEMGVMYKITFLHPYTHQQWLYQSFSTKEEAEMMIAFYRSCGSHARFV